MAKLVINSYEEFESHLGEVLGVSDWLQIDQDRINLFADATLDHQWIHVDVERAKKESQFNSTIAHGYLTLSIYFGCQAKLCGGNSDQIHHQLSSIVLL